MCRCINGNYMTRRFCGLRISATRICISGNYLTRRFCGLSIATSCRSVSGNCLVRRSRKKICFEFASPLEETFFFASPLFIKQIVTAWVTDLILPDSQTMIRYKRAGRTARLWLFAVGKRSLNGIFRNGSIAPRQYEKFSQIPVCFVHSSLLSATALLRL